MKKKETVEIIGAVLSIIVAGSVFIFCLGVLSKITPPNSGMTYYTAEIRYFEYRTIENISVSSDIILEGAAFVIKFELNKSKTYQLYYGYSKDGVIDEIHRIDTIYNKASELMWCQFNHEGFVGVVELVMDMCMNLRYEIGVVEIKEE